MAIFVPEVFADALQTDFLGKIKLLGLVAQVPGMEGQPGNAINLPYFAYAGDAAVVAAGDGAVPANLTGAAVKATVKKAVKAFAITDEDATQGAGDPVGQIRLQMAEALAGAMDTALVAAAMTATAKVGDGLNPISATLIINALAHLGDSSEGTVLVIHSRQLADVYKDSTFVKASDIGAPIMIGGMAAVGMLYGMPVIVSDRINVNGGKYTAIAMKQEALVLGYKRAPIVEEQRDVLKGQSYIVGNVHFAVALAKDAKVCLIETSVGTIA